jgi:tyrosine-specific transport protein
VVSRFIGATFLIIGTCVGGGLLALPMVTAGVNFYVILACFFAVWAFMTLSAMMIVELNLNLHGHSNLISMAKVTLGKPGIVFTWIVYLMLLYALISLYLSGGTDIVQGLFKLMSIHISSFWSTILFFAAFAIILYQGIVHIDWSNRALIILKFIAFFLIIYLLVPVIHVGNLNHGHNVVAPINIIMPVIFSFGFGTVVPSLVVYLNRHKKASRTAVFVGSLFPLLVYIIWIFTISGSVSMSSLMNLSHAKNSLSGLSAAVGDLTASSTIDFLIHFFTTICITTSFLGVSLSLLDFLADGLKVKRISNKTALRVMVAAFLPPLLIVFIEPGIFIGLLKYAGILCVLLLILLPTMMTWSARYKKSLLANPPFYCHWSILTLNTLVGVALLGVAVKTVFFA